MPLGMSAIIEVDTNLCSLAGGQFDAADIRELLKVPGLLVGEAHQLVAAVHVLDAEEPDRPRAVHGNVLGEVTSAAKQALVAIDVHLTLGEITAPERVQPPDRAHRVDGPREAFRRSGEFDGR